jgi:putative N6-adenine-specific DNA methylase
VPTPPRSTAAGPHRFLATTVPGLEPLLADELRELGLDPQPTAGGPLVLQGDWAAAARVMVRSRIASRLLLSLREFSARHQAMLYDQVRRIPWPEVFPPSRSIAVHAVGSTQGTDYRLSFAPLKIKDAICDEFRHRGLPRPDVNRRRPDVRLTAFFHRGRCELSMDLSGEPLHRRGYRGEGAEAPLRENRAAALLRFAGYDGSAPLADPFCGSGTIAIEAALIAMHRAPGLLRPAHGFAAARLFPECAKPLERERERAASEALAAPPHPIRGSDVAKPVLAMARENARKAGAGRAVRFEQRDALAFEATGGWIASNPPYGERLADRESAAELLREFVHRVKHHATGTRLVLVLPRGGLEKAVGLKPKRRLAVGGGSLALRFLLFEIYAGTRKGGAQG